MSDDQTRPIEPDAPAPPPAAPEQPAVQGQAPGQTPGQVQQPAYAMPLPPGYPAYGAPLATPPRPRFADQVMGMRAVVATAIACLIVGGLGGFALGRATGDDRGGRFGPGPGVFQRGTFPRGFPQGQNGFPNQPDGNSNQQPNQ